MTTFFPSRRSLLATLAGIVSLTSGKQVSFSLQSESNNPTETAPAWARNGVMYQIMPDRFYNGEPANDVQTGQYRYLDYYTRHQPWGSTPIVNSTDYRENQTVFFGGDLQGITQKLDYLKRTLGITILYLNPIFKAPSNHKYDVQDYYTVDPALGGNTALRQLVQAMHGYEHGHPGYVILDGVFNNTGMWHPWFNRDNANPGVVGAYQSQSSSYYNYYTFTRWPDQYASFLNLAYFLPKLNYGMRASAVRQAIYGAHDSVARYWLREYEIDGWRLDSAQYLDADGLQGSDDTNHQIWHEFRAAVKGVSPNAFIFGEYWSDASPWTNGEISQWDAATNYDGFTRPLSAWLTGADELGNAVSPLSVSQFDQWLSRTRANHPVAIQQVLPNFLSSHDTPRFAQRANGDPGKIRLAAIFQLTYVGLPTIYYGDEYGMLGANDPDNRRTFDWTQVTPGNTTVALFQKLIALRHAYAALRTGSFVTLQTDDRRNVYIYGRVDQRDRIIVVLNNATTGQDIIIPADQLYLVDDRIVTEQLTGTNYRVQNGQVQISVAAQDGAILI